MRIGYLVGTYPAVSHTFISREVAELRRRGVEVVTFSVHRPGPEQLLTDADRQAAAETRAIQPPRGGEVAAAHVRAFARAPRRYLQTLGVALRGAPRGFRNALWALFHFAEAIMLWDWCRQERVRHVHAHFGNAASTICMLYAHYGEPAGASWSFTMHGPTEFDDVGYHRLAEKARTASFVACISHYARSQLMKLVDREVWERMQIVRCGLDPATFAPRAAGERAGEPTHVLCVGRLVPDKGQALLLEAVAQLVERGLDLRLTVIGDGPDRAALERLARDRGIAEHVTFTGAVGQDEIPRHYARADVFCLPSFAEGVPVVLMEAMATGLPVVSTRVMGIPELVTDGVSGLLVAPGRAEPIADAIGALAADPELRAAMGAEGRAKVIRDHDIRICAEALHRLLLGLTPVEPVATAAPAVVEA